MSLMERIKGKVLFVVKHDIKSFFVLIQYIFRIIHSIGKKRNIYLFGVPFHTNLGDQAQTFCIINWVKQNISECNVLPFCSVFDLNGLLLRILSLFIKKNDIILCHSGYHMGELYPQYLLYISIVRRFSKNKIIVFPQTINFKNCEEAKRVAAIFDRHDDCYLLCRDSYSYDIAKKLFQKTQILLYPDIVTSLIGKFNYDVSNRNGVLFCIRNDKEAYYRKSEINSLRSKFLDIRTDIIDTYISTPVGELINNREDILNKEFARFSQYKLVITDRYHGVIFSLISNTPVVILTTIDHKLSSGVKWFPMEIFAEYVYYANDLNEAYEDAVRILKTVPARGLPPYFYEKYYSLLSEKLNIKK